MKFIIILILVFCLHNIYGQDIIQLINGETIESTIISLQNDSIKYTPKGLPNYVTVQQPFTNISNIKFGAGSNINFNPLQIQQLNDAIQQNNAGDKNDVNTQQATDPKLMNTISDLTQQLKDNTVNDNINTQAIITAVDALTTNTNANYTTLYEVISKQNLIIEKQNEVLDSIYQIDKKTYQTTTSQAQIEENIPWHPSKVGLGINIFLRQPIYPNEIIDPDERTIVSGNMVYLHINAANACRIQFNYGIVASKYKDAYGLSIYSEQIIGAGLFYMYQHSKYNMYAGPMVEFIQFKYEHKDYVIISDIISKDKGISTGFTTGAEYVLGTHFSVGAEVYAYLFSVLDNGDTDNQLFSTQARIVARWYF